MKYKDIFKKSKISQLSDQKESYNITNKHDKIFRTILDKKEEAVTLINQAIKTKLKAGNYNLVDINDYTKEELLQEKTLISKMMLLEKSESTEESIEMLEKIIPNTNKEEKELLKRVISILFGEKIGEEKQKN